MNDYQRRCRYAAIGAVLLAGTVAVLGHVLLGAHDVFLILGGACLLGAAGVAAWLT